MIRRLPTLLATCLAATVLLAAGCSGDEDGDWKGETIRLGSIFSTTGDGAAFGPQQLKAAKLAVEQINAGGGVNGAELSLEQRDDAGDPAESARLMEGLTEEGESLAVLGPTFSNSSAEAHPVANDLETPVLAVSNTGPGIVGDCPYPCDWIFRNSLGEAEAIPANVRQYLSAEDPDGVVDVVYPRGDAFGRSSALVARQAFLAEGLPRSGVKLLQTEPDGSIDTFRAYKRGAYIVTASSGEVVVKLIRSLRAWDSSASILGGNAFNSVTAAEELGEAGNGARSAAAWFAGNDSQANQRFMEDYVSRYGEDPDQFAAQAYTGVKLLAEAAASADLSFDDLTADREAIRDSLEGVQMETPLGEFRFTPDHDVSQPIWIVEMNGKGGYRLIKEVPAPQG